MTFLTIFLKKFGRAKFPKKKWKHTHGTWRKSISLFYCVKRLVINSSSSMAGGETSGSAMASIIYFLLKTPEAYEKLNQEVRGAYSSFYDIDVASTTKLEYLMAVLKEGMRIFPTAPQGTPRVSPGITVEGHYVPKGVSQ